MTAITIIEREGCVDCANANDLLNRLQQEDPAVLVRHIASDEPVARRIIDAVHAREVPVVLVDDAYFAQGAIDEQELRTRLAAAATATASTAHAAHEGAM